MKYLMCLLPLIVVQACNSPETQIGLINPPLYYLDFTGYGEKLEPGYIKVFSDSSWEEYGGIDSLGGMAYLSILASDSTTYYYTLTSGQYAGYKLADQDPIIFDVPLPFLPTRWPSDTTFSRTATFTTSGYSVAITESYTLIDTAAVVTPLGTFSPAPHFYVETYETVSDGEAGYGAQELWTARGPGEIIIMQEGQTAVYFIRGYVNGRTWDSTTPVQKSAPRGGMASGSRMRSLPRGLKFPLGGAIVRSKGLFTPAL